MIRHLLMGLLGLALPTVAAEDDLFTGVPEKQQPAEVQAFLRNLTNAMNTGEPASVMRWVSNEKMTGSGWVLFRTRLIGITKERSVKKIDLVEGVADADLELKRNGVTFKATMKPTHTVTVRLEGTGGEVSLLELPAAKVPLPVGNGDRWMLIGMIPQLDPGSTARLEEAKLRMQSSPDSAYGQVEWLYVNALLGRRKEVEEAEAKLIELAGGKAQNQKPYIYTQLGWARFNLDDVKKCEEYFQKAVEVADGKYPQAELGYAVSLYTNGQRDLAVQHFEHAAGQLPAMADRSTFEDYLKASPPKERNAALDLQSLWLRAVAPR